MMYWIYDYPAWVMGLLFCGALVAFTWLGIFLLGLVAVATYQNYANAPGLE